MTVSVFELFSIGIGPSSSHTVGPMRAAQRFVADLADRGLLVEPIRVEAELFGSLAATGAGHGTLDAVLLGLEGLRPETISTDTKQQRLAWMAVHRRSDRRPDRIPFTTDDIVCRANTYLPEHPNAMTLRAFGIDPCTQCGGNPSLGGRWFRRHGIGVGRRVVAWTRRRHCPMSLFGCPGTA